MGNIFNNDFRDFIKALNEAKVEYILVGGYAVIFHGFKRTTGDMDIWVNKTKQNYKKIEHAFKLFGMPVFDMDLKKFISKHTESEVFRFGISPSRIDLMTKVKGLDFNEAFESAIWFTDDDLNTRVIHYNTLIKAKKASKRSKDYVDIEELEKIKNAR
ncbi:MAG: hypothetical protein SFY32_14320 [Bacteroidota bacterium]|nr:hypothetical protein [Bacteroidota bacterium]